MLSGGRDETRQLGQTYGVYAVAIVILVTVVAMLAQLGVVEKVVGFLVVAVTLASYAVIGVLARTLNESAFFTAGRAVPPIFNGLATAAAFLGVAGGLGLAGAFFNAGAAAAAIILGIAIGFALLAVLVAPYFRKSGALTIADFLAIRYGGRSLRRVGIVVLLAATFPALAASIAAAGWIGTLLFGARPEVAVTAAAAITLFSVLFGGMRGVTLVAGAQAIVFLLALLVPAGLVALRDNGLPLPQLTYGYAVQEIASADGTLPTVASHFLPLAAYGWSTLFGIVLSLAAGVAALPQVLMRSATAPSVDGARRAAGWALVFVLAVLLTVPAIGALAKLAVFRDVVSSAPDDLPDWIFTYGRLGLVKLCGASAASPAAVQTACAAALGPDGIIGAADIAINPDMVAVGFAEMTDLPYVVTALIAAGGIAAALAAAAALLAAAAAALGSDLYGKLLNPRATAGRRLIVTRLLIVALAALAGWFALHRADASFALAAAAPSIAAAGFFPAIILGIWWRRTTRLGALAGVVAGFGIVLIHLLLAERGGPGILFGFGSAAVPPLAAGSYGLVIGFAVVIAVSLVTPVPDEERDAIIDAIRRPRRDAVLEDGGA